MPTSRRRRPQAVREPLSPALRGFLETGDHGDPEAEGFVEMFTLSHPRKRAALAAWWHAVRGELLRDWIAEFPGRRPFAWWLFDAPEPHRRRLGGIGTPAHECLAYVPSFRFGIRATWIDRFSQEYYNGRVRDIHGNRIGAQYAHRPEPFRGRAIDRADPPRYEAQAAYLARLGLLGPAERLALPAHAFEDEVILSAADDEDDR